MNITKLLSTIALATMTLTTSAQHGYVGGDISMLTKHEEKAGVTWLDKDGNSVVPLTFFKELGMNAMRVRLFVDPSNASDTEKNEGVCQDIEYVKALGKRIKDAGFAFMLDFHYSDTWTDPSKHAVPTAWSSMTTDELKEQIYTYTVEALSELKEAGVTPDFIQPGNEVTYGMLWPTGRIYPAGGAPTGGSWDNFIAYTNQAIKGCREVCPDAKIVLHAELGTTSNAISFYRNVAKYDVDYDIIGLSYYPDFHGKLTNLENVINKFETSYPDKPIMIVETGYSYAWALGGAKDAYKEIYPYTEAGQEQFTSELIAMLNEHDNVTGLFWWWPEQNEYGNTTGTQVTTYWWNASLFDSCTGKAQAAIYLLQDFLTDEAGIVSVVADDEEANTPMYNLAGQRVGENAKGLVIKNGKKTMQK